MKDSLRIGVLSAGYVPMGEVLLVGVVPVATELHCGLTPQVRTAVGPAISAMLAELTRLGVQSRLRKCALPPSIWWQDNVSSNCLAEEDHVPGYPW